METEKLKECLSKGIVEIQFRSLASNKTHNREYTLCENYLPLPNHIKKQNGDKVICYDVEFQRWEDIDVGTIEHWKPIQEL